MSLTAEQHRQRDGKFTASFAPYLMAGDKPKIMREWQRLVGADYEPEDLSDNWPVQFGSYIETFALDWHQCKTGRALTRRGEVVTHPQMPHVCCTLDAYDASREMVIDCKALGAWTKLDDRCDFYLPQLIVQRACVGAKEAALLIVHGGSEPAERPLEIPASYEAAVWERIGEFWACVRDLVPPVEMEPVAPPVQAIRVVDMSPSNSWLVLEAQWLENYAPAKRFEEAAKELRALVEADVVIAKGKLLQAKRNKAGALSITKMKEA